MMEYHSLQATIDGEKKYLYSKLTNSKKCRSTIGKSPIQRTLYQSVQNKCVSSLNLMKNTEFRNIVRCMALNHAGREDLALSSLSA